MAANAWSHNSAIITISLRTFCTISEKTEFEITKQNHLENLVSSEPIYSFLSLPADKKWHIYSGVTIICLASSNYLFCKKEKSLNSTYLNPFITSQNPLLKIQWDLEKQPPVHEHVTGSPDCTQDSPSLQKERTRGRRSLYIHSKPLSQPSHLCGTWVTKVSKNPCKVYFYQFVNGF